MAEGVRDPRKFVEEEVIVDVGDTFTTLKLFCKWNPTLLCSHAGKAIHMKLFLKTVTFKLHYNKKNKKVNICKYH